MMIMRIKSSLFISLCLILLTMSITAQDKQLSLHDLIPGGKTYSRFVPRDSYNGAGTSTYMLREIAC